MLSTPHLYLEFGGFLPFQGRVYTQCNWAESRQSSFVVLMYLGNAPSVYKFGSWASHEEFLSLYPDEQAFFRKWLPDHLPQKSARDYIDDQGRLKWIGYVSGWPWSTPPEISNAA